MRHRAQKSLRGRFVYYKWGAPATRAKYRRKRRAEQRQRWIAWLVSR